jgi:uncharacterized protein (DUF952 family)
MIYRISERSDWRAALRSGEFASADLVLEGFIHCSEREQILPTAHRYFSGKQGLVLLEIDDARIGEFIRREDLAGRGETFLCAHSIAGNSSSFRFWRRRRW